jgi:hypothetical protein
VPVDHPKRRKVTIKARYHGHGLGIISDLASGLPPSPFAIALAEGSSDGAPSQVRIIVVSLVLLPNRKI